MPYANESINIELLSEENVKKYVLPYYGLKNSQITQIKVKNTEKQRAVYRVKYNDTSYCLKKIYFPLNELLFVYSALEWLFRNNINVPKIISALSKNRFVEYNKMLFILTPWIEGEKCNYDKDEHVTSSINNLALIHRRSANFIPISGSSNRTGYEDIGESLNKHLEQLLSCSNYAYKYNDDFSKKFLQFFEKSVALSKASSSVASTINNINLTKSLCHMDYVNKNIIFDENFKPWTIDFDKCRLDYCTHDISYFLRRYLKRDATNWNTKKAIECLNNYDNVKPLNIDEYKYIYSYLVFPQKFWKISRDYYNNINICNKLSFTNLIERASNNIDSQIRFSEEFKEYIEEKFLFHLD